jgi:SpoVK/Ycf46/Vps4 family AAA+-type ATPase
MCEWATKAVHNTPSITGFAELTAVAPIRGTREAERRRSKVQW